MKRRNEYTFSNFIGGESNALALAVAVAAAEHPGEVMNPLYIVGKNGLGKTHLLNAIANHIRKHSPETAICMLSGHDLITVLLEEMIGKQKSPWYRDQVQSGVILLDEVAALEGKPATQEEVYLWLRSALKNGSQIVLASYLSPDKLPDLTGDLFAHSERSLFASIQPLDRKTCNAVVRQKADERELRLSEDAIEYIVSHAEGYPSRVEGIVTNLEAQQTLLGATIEISAVRAACRIFE